MIVPLWFHVLTHSRPMHPAGLSPSCPTGGLFRKSLRQGYKRLCFFRALSNGENPGCVGSK